MAKRSKKRLRKSWPKRWGSSYINTGPGERGTRGPTKMINDDGTVVDVGFSYSGNVRTTGQPLPKTVGAPFALTRQGLLRTPGISFPRQQALEGAFRERMLEAEEYWQHPFQHGFARFNRVEMGRNSKEIIWRYFLGNKHIFVREIGVTMVRSMVYEGRLAALSAFATNSIRWIEVLTPQVKGGDDMAIVVCQVCAGEGKTSNVVRVVPPHGTATPVPGYCKKHEHLSPEYKEREAARQKMHHASSLKPVRLNKVSFRQEKFKKQIETETTTVKVVRTFALGPPPKK